MSVTHFVDLSPYIYNDTDVIGTDDGWVTYRPRYERLNVGWLNAPEVLAGGSAALARALRAGAEQDE